MMSALVNIFKNVILSNSELTLKIAQAGTISVRYKKEKPTFVDVPEPGKGKAFRRIVHFPDKYTVEPLRVTNLGGRDPVTGRKVVGTLGGGIKHKYHWIKWIRDGPEEGPPQEEKVLQILKCGCRTAHVALVAVKDQLKYILATENMKAGDIIKTSKFIPRNPVRPNEGDAYPLGALPLGTIVHNMQMYPDSEYTLVHSAGSFATLKRHLGPNVVVQLPSKQEMALDRRCMATVGRLSNVEHSSIPIGSPNRLRELGYRPRSGLWQRKKGIHGRKIRPPPPLKFPSEAKPEVKLIKCSYEKFN